jgi:serine protease AprX
MVILNPAGWSARAAILTVLLFVASLGFAQAGQRMYRQDDPSGSSPRSKMSPELAAFYSRASRSRASSQSVQVIVQFRQSPVSKQLQKVAGFGGVGTRSLNLVRGGVFNLPLSALKAWADDPNVVYMSPNRSVSGAADYSEVAVGADLAQSSGWDGSGIGVAVIDSGISDHADLHDPATGQSRVVYSESFLGNSDTTDSFGHGTHVAGIIAGNAQKSGGLNGSRKIFGVAPSVKLINLKVLDGNGKGKDSYVIAALQRAIALKNTYNIRVVNLSLGRPVYESYKQDPLCQAVEAAWKAGLVVVVAAGNQGRNNDYGTNGYGMIAAPGNDPYVITVGAMNTLNTRTTGDDVIASYSSKGPSMLDHVIKPDLVAPGNRIASLLVSGSTLDQQFRANEVSPSTYGASLSSPKAYFRLSGTSMATPVVSGAAALLLDKDPTLTPDVVKARLMKTADKIFPAHSQAMVNGVLVDYQYDIFTVGAGYLDIPGALANTDPVTGTAHSPVAVRDSSGTTYLLADASSVWTSSVIWGSSVVWGNTLLAGSSVIWGSSVVWGNRGLDGCSVIWGSSVIWGAAVGATDADNDALSVDGNGDDTADDPVQ